LRITSYALAITATQGIIASRRRNAVGGGVASLRGGRIGGGIMTLRVASA